VLLTTEFCATKPPLGNLDNNAPCETPSDLIFILDPKTEELTNSSQRGLVLQVISKISKIDRYAGTVSVFVNTNQLTSVELPPGTTWPLGALIFNATSTGSMVGQLTPQSRFPLLFLRGESPQETKGGLLLCLTLI
jgi:hypothetical protein